MSNLGSLGMPFVIGMTIIFSMFIAYPLVGLIFVVIVEQILASFGFLDFSKPDLWDVRAVINSFLAALFMGCITQFILTFVSEVVMTAMDVILFCYAIDDDKGSHLEGFNEQVRKAFPDKGEPNSGGDPSTATQTI